jgi:hypothetical protein
MNELKFRVENVGEFLIRSGYVKRDDFRGLSYFFETKDGRFHATVKGKQITLHFDKLVRGFHTVFPSKERLLAEKKRIITLVHKVVKNQFCYYCSVCGKASGDGDGLVGMKCKGKPLLTPNETK